MHFHFICLMIRRSIINAEQEICITTPENPRQASFFRLYSFSGQGRVTYELILSSLQLFLKKLVFLRAILYNEAWEKNFMP